MIKPTQNTLIFILITLVLMCGWHTDLLAIEVNPNELAIQAAIQKGKEAANAKIPPTHLYWHFGPTESLEPHGFLMTKLGGLAVMSSHFGLRSEMPTEQDIKQILNGSELQVSVTVFGSTSRFAVDSYVVLKQSDHLIKPRRVRSDARASRSTAWPDIPPYKARIIASFAYGTFDPTAPTAIVVFPGEGGEIEFELDFSKIP